MEKAGGFTITSTPSQALLSSTPAGNLPYLELAIQQSPSNPPAAWLWQPPKKILGSELNVRVGGSFTWPPHEWSSSRIHGIKKVIFVAGGVGINPLMSMVSSILASDSAIPRPKEIVFLYSSKVPSSSSSSDKDAEKESAILFVPRLTDLATKHTELDLTLFLTGKSAEKKIVHPESLGWFHHRRIEAQDLEAALGEDGREETVVYVCGPPAMTDELVGWFEKQKGLEGRVFCEKWW